MKIAKEYINPKYVTYISELLENEEGDELKGYMFAANSVDGLRYKFYFGSKEYGNKTRNELIELVNKCNG